jgi:hypothetical protein
VAEGPDVAVHPIACSTPMMGPGASLKHKRLRRGL